MSHLRIAAAPEAIQTVRIASGGANNSPEVINNDLMGTNTATSGIEGFKNDLAAWNAMPPGPGRETAKQGLLDQLHTTLESGVDQMIRNDLMRRVPAYQAL